MQILFSLGPLKHTKKNQEEIDPSKIDSEDKKVKEDFNVSFDDDKASFRESRSSNLHPGDIVVYQDEIIHPGIPSGKF